MVVADCEPSGGAMETPLLLSTCSVLCVDKINNGWIRKR